MPQLRAWPLETCPRASQRRAVATAAEFVGVVLLFTAATAVAFRQWLPRIASALIGPPEDNLQDLWNVWYAAVGWQAGPFFHTDLLRFPEGASLYLHSFAYPKVVAVALLTRIVGTDIGTLVFLHNLSILISFPLAGAGAFYLARHLTGTTAGALLGGFVLAFNPSHMAHAMHHAGVASIEFIPPFVLFYLRAVERRSPACLALATVFYALAALSSWYYLVSLACFVLFHLLCVAARDRRLAAGWHLAAAVACPVVTIVMLAPILLPMASAARDVAAGGESGLYVADLLGFVAFPRFHALAPLADSFYDRFTGNAWEATVYIGLANMLLLAWVCLGARAKSAPVLTYALCGAAAFGILACGSRLHVLGQDTVPLPWAAVAWLPLASIMQAPSRAIAVAYVLLAVAVAEAARIAWLGGRRLARVVLAGLAALIVADYAPARPLSMTPFACPTGLDVIRNDPEPGFGVLDLPPHGYAERNLFMAQQACHGRPIVLGNTSRRLADTLGDRLDTWNVEAQRRQLVAARVKFVVLRLQVVSADTSVAEPAADPLRPTWRGEDAPRSHYEAAYTLVHDGADLAIFRVY